MDRYSWLEKQLDRDDLDIDSEEYDLYTKEINALQDTRNKQQAIQKLIREQRLRDIQEERELAKVFELTEEHVEKMYIDTCTRYQDVNGMSFKSWYDQSLKYYTIDDKHNVNARARSEDTVEIIEHPTLAQAKLTILRRIKYKFYDHAVRGHDFAYEI